MSQNHVHESASMRMGEIITALQQQQEKSIQLNDLIAIIGRRAFSLIIITFALFNVLPVSLVPGVSLITGIPIAIIGLQLLIGRTYLWLPEFIAHKKLPARTVAQTLKKGQSLFRKLEYLLKPRITFLFSTIGLRILALLIIAISLMLMLPIPFSNNILGSILILFALSLLEYDGVILIIALAITTAYFILIWNLGMYLWNIMANLIH